MANITRHFVAIFPAGLARLGTSQAIVALRSSKTMDYRSAAPGVDGCISWSQKPAGKGAIKAYEITNDTMSALRIEVQERVKGRHVTPSDGWVYLDAPTKFRVGESIATQAWEQETAAT